jgi:hypothetical protein
MTSIQKITTVAASGMKQLVSNAKYGCGVGQIVSIMEGSSKLGTAKNIVQGVVSTSVKPIAETIAKDVIGIKNMPIDLNNAYKLGKESAKALNSGKAASVWNILKSVYKSGIKPHIAGLLGSVGLALPIPLSQPILYTLGKLLQFIG